MSISYRDCNSPAPGFGMGRWYPLGRFLRCGYCPICMVQNGINALKPQPSIVHTEALCFWRLFSVDMNIFPFRTRRRYDWFATQHKTSPSQLATPNWIPQGNMTSGRYSYLWILTKFETIPGGHRYACNLQEWGLVPPESRRGSLPISQARFSAGLVRPCRVTLARLLKSKNAKTQ